MSRCCAASAPHVHVAAALAVVPAARPGLCGLRSLGNERRRDAGGPARSRTWTCRASTDRLNSASASGPNGECREPLGRGDVGLEPTPGLDLAPEGANRFIQQKDPHPSHRHYRLRWREPSRIRRVFYAREVSRTIRLATSEPSVGVEPTRPPYRGGAVPDGRRRVADREPGGPGGFQYFATCNRGMKPEAWSRTRNLKDPGPTHRSAKSIGRVPRRNRKTMRVLYQLSYPWLGPGGRTRTSNLSLRKYPDPSPRPILNG